MFLGLDSSTQSLTTVIIDPASGEISCQLSVDFGTALPQYVSPSGFIPSSPNGEVHANPLMWLDVLDLLFSRLREKTDLSKVRMIAGSDQQHGSVYLDATFEDCVGSVDAAQSLVSQLSSAFTRATSPIWMDTPPEPSARKSPPPWVAPLRSAGAADPRPSSDSAARRSGAFSKPIRAYARTARIHLVSSFLASVIAGKSVPIDFGDGAGRTCSI